MAERERTRVREKEPPGLDGYELGRKADQAFKERQNTGRVVARLEDCPQILARQGFLRYYLNPLMINDTPLQDWKVFTHEVRTHSGKHRHQGGLVIYVIKGVGYSVVDGERVDWKAGDLLLLPLKPEGVEHQHFNTHPEGKPALWMAFINQTIREYVAMETTQVENSPDYQKEKGGG